MGNDDAYFLILFKIEGHSRWRAYLSQTEEEFTANLEGTVKITEKKVLRINRETAEIDISEPISP